MKIWKNIFIFSMLLLSVIACSDKSPTKPKTVKPSSFVKITVEDTFGRSINGIFSSLELHGPNSFYSFLILKNNSAVIGPVVPGIYYVMFRYSETDTLTKQDFDIFFKNDFLVEADTTIESKFFIPKEVNLKAVIKNYNGITGFKEPLKGALIKTEPETVTIISDENGCIDLGTVPLRGYKFSIEKYNTVVYNIENGLVYHIFNGNLNHVEVIYLKENLQPPVIEIISPVDYHFQNVGEVHLIGDGYDFEDDILPESALTWYSSINGKLGTGRELLIDTLVCGIHTITLVGTDSHNNQTETSITVYISFFDIGAYFPLPINGYWNYRYETTEFSVIDEIKGEEIWSLNDLKVSSDDVNTRSCLMEYSITRGDTKKYCRYYVVDYYDGDSENIYVSKTTECIQIFDNESSPFYPTEQLDIETVYTPHYFLFNYYLDTSTIDTTYETSVTSEVTWEYHNVNSELQVIKDTIDIRTSYNIGEAEIVQTDIGSYEAIPITVNTEDTQRKWWLAKGIGILRLEYDTFDFPLSAVLYETNIFSYDYLTKPVLAQSKPSFYLNNILPEVQASPSGTPERMMELSKLLKGLCPR